MQVTEGWATAAEEVAVIPAAVEAGVAPIQTGVPAGVEVPFTSMLTAGTGSPIVTTLKDANIRIGKIIVKKKSK